MKSGKRKTKTIKLFISQHDLGMFRQNWKTELILKTISIVEVKSKSLNFYFFLTFELYFQQKVEKKIKLLKF